MAIHSSVLAWKIPQTEEPCRLQSMGSDTTEHSPHSGHCTHTHSTHIHTDHGHTSHTCMPQFPTQPLWSLPTVQEEDRSGTTSCKLRHNPGRDNTAPASSLQGSGWEIKGMVLAPSCLRTVIRVQILKCLADPARPKQPR